jgi:tetratricopeptide (TPR) repeat protein
MKGTPFKRANVLWFREGRTARALDAYEAALRAAPDDPVVAFQFARALWSVGRFDRARVLLERAGSLQDRLSSTGRRVLEGWLMDVAGPPPEYPYPQLDANMLDRDRLDAGPLPEGGWRMVAAAAAARSMFGLAAYAIDRWGGVPFDADEAKEIGHILTSRDAEEAMLAQM